MACDGTLLSAYLDDELTDTERRGLEAHLKACPACAAELESLEKTRTMLTAYAVPAGLHERLSTRLDREARRRDTRPGLWTAGLAAAAALAVLAGTLLYFNQEPSAGPDAPAVAPVVTQHEKKPAAPAPVEVAQAPAPQPATGTPAAEAPALAQTELPLELRGTVEGAVPQAVIADTGTGRSGTYGIDDEVRPGVRLKEVRSDAVVLSLPDGESRVLALGSTDAPVKSLSGNWIVTISVNGEKQDRNGAALTEEAGRVVMRVGGLEGARVDTEKPGPVLQGTRSGQRLVLASTDKSALPNLSLTGTLDDSMDRVTGTVTGTDPEGNVESVQFEMVRITEEFEQEHRRQEELEKQRREELQALFEPLRRYAEANDARFPGALRDLVPATLPDLELYANTDGRIVQYVPGASLPNAAGALSASSYEGRSMRDALLAWERDLQQAWSSDIPFRAVLQVEYRDPAGRYAVGNSGAVVKLSQAEPATSEEDAARDRANSQNNLKQWGVILKMFSSEHHGYLPGGWLSTYPEYLTDVAVLTAPWDEPLTESYELLFPAMTETELVQMAEQMGLEPDMDRGTEVPGTTQREAALQALIPIIVEKRGEPFLNKCRNVLFLDGHVECVSPSRWADEVAPFLAIAGRGGVSSSL